MVFWISGYLMMVDSSILLTIFLLKFGGTIELCKVEESPLRTDLSKERKIIG
jgi:hypothetical protein